MRGDRPPVGRLLAHPVLFTPHARGSTLVILNPFVPKSSLPRMRGDRPIEIVALGDDDEFTPHARGSTSEGGLEMRVITVYPACAGIDPSFFWPTSSAPGLPRMRGDRPSSGAAIRTVLAFTPHARGSTLVLPIFGHFLYVYPACAGIDRPCPGQAAPAQGLPRMRGDRPQYTVIPPFV